jgi:putative lipoprotein
LPWEQEVGGQDIAWLVKMLTMIWILAKVDNKIIDKSYRTEQAMLRIFPQRRLMLAAMALFLAAASSEAASQVITGTALYRERLALPPGAVFEATLEDISRADAPAEVLGTARLEPAGQPPFRFEISYDRNRIQPNHSYAVRARVSHEGRLLYTTDRLYPVLTRGHGNSVDLLLRAVPTKRPSPQGMQDYRPGTTWGQSGDRLGTRF